MNMYEYFLIYLCCPQYKTNWLTRSTVNGKSLSLSLSAFFEFNTRDERGTSSSELSLPTSFSTKSSHYSGSVPLLGSVLLSDSVILTLKHWTRYILLQIKCVKRLLSRYPAVWKDQWQTEVWKWLRPPISREMFRKNQGITAEGLWSEATVGRPG